MYDDYFKKLVINNENKYSKEIKDSDDSDEKKKYSVSIELKEKTYQKQIDWIKEVSDMDINDPTKVNINYWNLRNIWRPDEGVCF